MGNYMCVSGRGQQVRDEWQGPPAKVILPDGSIEVLKRLATAGELMKQHPEHLVCHSSAMISALTPKSALPAERELEGGRLYYILPAHKFQKAAAPAAAAKGENVGDFSFEIKHSKTAPGFAQVTVKGQGVSKLLFDGGRSGGGEPLVSYSTPDLRSMYLAAAGSPQAPTPSLVRCNSWKPRLETINEVGAASRRHIQNFMRARSLRKSQVHNF